MDAKQVKLALQECIESHLADYFVKSGFKWKNRSLTFQRKTNDFVQNVIFFFTPSRYTSDDSIGSLNIMVRFDSKEINHVANKLNEPCSEFEKIDTVLNVDAGIIASPSATVWHLSSIEALEEVVESKIVSLIVDDIIPFLDSRREISTILKDFESCERYIFWTSNGGVALRVIAMYYILGDFESAKKIAKEYYESDGDYKKRYKNILSRFDSL